MHFTGEISLKPIRGLRVKTFSVTLLLTLLSGPLVFGQLSDHFSDGNFSENPSWNGVAENFIVNANLQLQLNSNAAGTSWLSAEFSASSASVLEWEFFVKQAFAPSGANFGRIYLMSDEADLTAPLNGYYLQFGEAGSNDAVELFVQSGDAAESVCRATAGSVSAAFQITVKVRRVEGLWELYVDYDGGTNYVLEATGVDDTHRESFFFGVACTYTVTNAARFYFDDFTIRKFDLPDTTPPQVESVSFMSPTRLNVYFDEEVEGDGAEDPLHYLVSDSTNPVKAVLQADGKTVALTFEQEFRNGYEVSLVVERVADLAGNVMTRSEKKILYFAPSPVSFGDVVITEIFADPAPQVKLPTSEFVEVFNRSVNPVQLGGWRFSDGATNGLLSACILLPGQYAVICSSGDVTEFKRFGLALASSNFPTLNNDDDHLTLLGPDAKVVDSVHYHSGWYKDEDKAAGGWTLERIDTDNFCRGDQNWIASRDPAGGTPGKPNSVSAHIVDNMGPKLLYAVPISADTLVVVFDEKLDAVTPAPEAFTLTPAVAITAVNFFDDSRKSVSLTLAAPIRSRLDYSLHAGGIYDCPGNRLQEDFSWCTFVLPEQAERGDIVINEVLFNPTSTGVDFVEIYNRSEKTIDLLNWSLRNSGSSAGKNRTVVADNNLLIKPNTYCAFAEDLVVLQGEYVNADPKTLWEADIPAFNDDEGSVALLNADGLVIDSMRYSEDLHSPFLKDPEGVSLERISAMGSGFEPANWHSASSTTGYATPGYVNASRRTDFGLGDESVVVEPEIIQRAIGAAAFARIRFHFSQAGLVANVRIFDSEGRAIRAIAENALLGTEGFFRWDGDRDSGAAARMGYYLVWFEVFDAEGVVKTYQKRIAVY